MLASVFSCAIISLDGVVVEVEVDTSLGLAGLRSTKIRKACRKYLMTCQSEDLKISLSPTVLG